MESVREHANSTLQHTDQNERTRPHTRERGAGGRFVSKSSGLVRYTANLQRQKRYRGMNILVGIRAFEKLLDRMFLSWPKNEWIPSARKVGPFFNIVRLIFKPKFRVTSRKQAKLMRTVYFNRDEQKKGADLPSTRTRASDNPSGRKKLVRAYRGRRLPRLRSRSEGERAVKKWITQCKDKDILSEDDTEKAYGIVLSCVEAHSMVKGKSAYVGYPRFSIGGNSEVVQNYNSSRASTPRNSVPLGRICTSREEGINRRRTSDGNSEDGNGLLQPSLRLEISRENGTRTVDENAQRNANVAVDGRILWTKAVIRAARDDRLFNFMCQVWEEEGCGWLGAIAGVLLDVVHKERIETSFVMLDALKYAQEKHMGVCNGEEHLTRERRIRQYVHDLKYARRWLRCGSFEDMQWQSSGFGVEGRLRMNSSPISRHNSARISVEAREEAPNELGGLLQTSCGEGQIPNVTPENEDNDEAQALLSGRNRSQPDHFGQLPPEVSLPRPQQEILCCSGAMRPVLHSQHQGRDDARESPMPLPCDCSRYPEYRLEPVRTGAGTIEGHSRVLGEAMNPDEETGAPYHYLLPDDTLNSLNENAAQIFGISSSEELRIQEELQTDSEYWMIQDPFDTFSTPQVSSFLPNITNDGFESHRLMSVGNNSLVHLSE